MQSIDMMSNTGYKPFLSFIVPALNEEKLILSTIDSIKNAIGDRYPYEIIVIDNGSTDKTVSISRNASAMTYVVLEGTIAKLRNYGVEQSKGEILIFIDADVSLTDDWSENIDVTLRRLEENPLIITGSRCNPPINASWVAKAWFSEAERPYATTHMGTGHLITSKRLYDLAGGFSEELVTGEDYAFCKNAKRFGAIVVSEPNLRVIHFGVPETIMEFTKRETWHGIGDWTSLKTFISSKVAVLSILFSSLHIAALVLAFSGQLLPAVICGLIIIAMCSVISMIKYRHASIYVIAQNAILFYFYFSGRSYSLIRAIRSNSKTKSPRTGR